MNRWRDEIWIPYGPHFLKYAYIPNCGSDIPIITIEVQHQPSATELHLQWRPTHFTIGPFDLNSERAPQVPLDFVSKLREIQARPVGEQPDGRPFGPAQIIQFNHMYNYDDSARTVSRTGCFFFSRPTRLAPCSLDPANATLDWTGAWFSFMHTTRERWERVGEVEDHAAKYFFREAGDEWRTLARQHWAKLNRAEQQYFRRLNERYSPGYEELTARVYVSTYDYGEMESGWIPVKDRETNPVSL